MSTSNNPRILRVGYEAARLELARLKLTGENARKLAARNATANSAQALAVERVGIWLCNPDHDALLCFDQYERSRDGHVLTAPLRARDFPSYVAALREHRAIVADDARTHLLTRELYAEYLAPLGITSMLDAPIIREGEVIGVVCHEHVGPARSWSQKEIDFASSVADIVTTVFGQADRLDLQAERQHADAEQSNSAKMDALERAGSLTT